MHSHKSPLLFLLFFFLFFAISFAELCHRSDKIALLRIKEDFKDPYILTSWKPEKYCCTWDLVVCDKKSNRIISLNISSDKKLSGSIPDSVGDLTFLETLIFQKLPNLIGSISPSIQNLKILDLSGNHLDGPIPKFLGSLPNLSKLNLSYNLLTGSIPNSLPKLQHLCTFSLEGNKLQGSIPDCFGNFEDKNLRLYLSHNQLSGRIPTSIGKVNFDEIDLSGNKLEGDASFIFGARKTTKFVNLSWNLLELNLTKVLFPQTLRHLDLSHNKIFGEIPMGVTKLELQMFNVSYNELLGKIPIGGKLQSFDRYSYISNKGLCGKPLDNC